MVFPEGLPGVTLSLRGDFFPFDTGPGSIFFPCNFWSGFGVGLENSTVGTNPLPLKPQELVLAPYLCKVFFFVCVNPIKLPLFFVCGSGPGKVTRFSKIFPPIFSGTFFLRHPFNKLYVPFLPPFFKGPPPDVNPPRVSAQNNPNPNPPPFALSCHPKALNFPLPLVSFFRPARPFGTSHANVPLSGLQFPLPLTILATLPVCLSRAPKRSKSWGGDLAGALFTPAT